MALGHWLKDYIGPHSGGSGGGGTSSHFVAIHRAANGNHNVFMDGGAATDWLDLDALNEAVVRGGDVFCEYTSLYVGDSFVGPYRMHLDRATGVKAEFSTIVQNGAQNGTFVLHVIVKKQGTVWSVTREEFALS